MNLASRRWGPACGPVALLVHGGGESSATWTRVGEWLGTRGWQAFAVDLRGHGDSPVRRLDADQSLEAMARDLVETFAVLRPGLQRVDVLIGHSLGALVSLACVAGHPGFASRLVLEDPPGPGSLDFARLADEFRRVSEVARCEPDELFRGRLSQPSEQLPEDDRAAILAATIAADPAFVPAVVESLADVDLFGLAEQCRIPTLLVLARDKGAPLGSGAAATLAEDLAEFSSIAGAERARLCSALRHGDVRQIDAGHDLHRLRFAEYVSALAAWLGLPTDPAPRQDGAAGWSGRSVRLAGGLLS